MMCGKMSFCRQVLDCSAARKIGTDDYRARRHDFPRGMAYNRPMSIIERYLMDDPTLLLFAFGIAEIALVTSRFRRGRPKIVFLAVPPLLAGLVIAVDAGFETDREAIERISYEMADDFRAGKIETLAKRFAPTYSGFGGNRDMLIARIREESKRVGRLAISVIDIEVYGKRANMDIRTTVELAGGMVGGRRVPLWWNVHWARFPDGWKIEEAKFHRGPILK